MSWLTVLVALAFAAGHVSRGHVPLSAHHPSLDRRAGKLYTHRYSKPIPPRSGSVVTLPGASATATPGPGATATPGPGATPTPSPTPTPTPVPLPTRTSVQLNDAGDDYTMTSAYHSLAAGTVTFNATNNGMDEHNLTVGLDDSGNHDLDSVDLPPDQDTYQLKVKLPAGKYTLYCTLFNHASLGMETTITVK
jgi:plastocyanin